MNLPYADGSSYCGYLLDITKEGLHSERTYLRHGIGEQKWGTTAKYQGEWKNNFMHGKGTFIV